MTQQEILQIIIQVVKQSQEQSGRDVPNLNGDTHLIGDVPGCDSLILVELSFLLSDALAPLLNGRQIPDSVLFGSNPCARPTLNTIASDIKRFIEVPQRSGGTSTSAAKSKETRNAKARNPLFGSDCSGTALSNGTKPLPLFPENQLPKENLNEHDTGQPSGGTP